MTAITAVALTVWVALAPPLEETASSTAKVLAVIATTMASIGVIVACLKKIRKHRPVSWLERQLITAPIARKRAAANERIKSVVGDEVRREIAPLRHALDDLRRENSEQHDEVAGQLRALTERVTNLEPPKE